MAKFQPQRFSKCDAGLARPCAARRNNDTLATRKYGSGSRRRRKRNCRDEYVPATATAPERWDLNLSANSPWLSGYGGWLGWNEAYIRAKMAAAAAATAAALQAERDRIFEAKMVNQIAQVILKKVRIYAVDHFGTEVQIKFDIVVHDTYKRGKAMRLILRQPTDIHKFKRSSFEYVRIDIDPQYHPSLVENSQIFVDAVKLVYRTTHYNGTIIDAKNIDDDLGLMINTADATQNKTDVVELYTPMTEAEKRNPRKEDARLRSKLLNHFNTNIELYHQVLWWNMSAERRWMLLDGFIAPHSGGRSIASVVENRLMGVVGNCLVMPVAPGFHLDPTYTKNANEAFSLLEHYRPTSPAPAFRISVPTPGLFTEAVQGACNSCEKIDNTRNWKFQENPIPDKPTQIQPVSLDSRHDTNFGNNLQTKDFAQPIVNIQNAPAAPDFGGTAGILGLMGKSDLFRDMAGLDQTQKNALAGLQEAYKSANASQKAAIDMVVNGGLLQMAQNAYMEKNGDRMLESLQKGVDDKLIDEGTAKDIAADYYNRSLGGSPDVLKGKAKPDFKGYKDALKKLDTKGMNPDEKKRAETELAQQYNVPTGAAIKEALSVSPWTAEKQQALDGFMQAAPFMKGLDAEAQKNIVNAIFAVQPDFMGNIGSALANFAAKIAK